MSDEAKNEEYTRNILIDIQPFVKRLLNLGWSIPHVDDYEYVLLIIEAQSTGIHEGYMDEDGWYWVAAHEENYPSFPLMVKRLKKKYVISFSIPPGTKLFTADEANSITLISDSWDDAESNLVKPVIEQIEEMSCKLGEMTGLHLVKDCYLTKNQLEKVLKDNGLSSLEELNAMLHGVTIVEFEKESIDESSSDRHGNDRIECP